MITVTKLDELSFTVRFDEKMSDELAEVAAWGSLEMTLCSILCDALLGVAPPEADFPDADDLTDFEGGFWYLPNRPHTLP